MIVETGSLVGIGADGIMGTDRYKAGALGMEFAYHITHHVTRLWDMS